MGERKRPIRPGMKLVQAYVDESTVHRFKVVLAMRGQNMTEAITEWMQQVAETAPPLPPAKKPRRP